MPWEATQTTTATSAVSLLGKCRVYSPDDPLKTRRALSEALEQQWRQLNSNEQPRRTILCFLRRFGCPVCRALSAGTSLLADRYKFLANNIFLVAISIEEFGFEEFNQKGYFNAGKIFVNDDGSAFKLMQLKQLGLKNAYGLMDIRKVNAAIALASNEHFKRDMNFKGNAVQLGGMFVLDKGMKNIVYEFREKFAGDSPPVVDVLKSLEITDEKELEQLDQKQCILQLAQEAAAAAMFNNPATVKV